MLLVIQTEHKGTQMQRTTHKQLFRDGTINDVHDRTGWRAYTRGETENAFRNARQTNARLRK